LVQAGYKVGLVTQTETAALKAIGNNKGKPMTRALTQIYSKGTLIGQELDPIVTNLEEDGEVSSQKKNTVPHCSFYEIHFFF
jgi:hypothetical protein